MHLSPPTLVPHFMVLPGLGANCQAGPGSGYMCDPRCRRDAVPPPELKTDANSRNEGCFHLWKYISVACAYVGLFLPALQKPQLS